MEKPTFSPEQRAELTDRLGIPEFVVIAIETNALPFAKRILLPEPRRNEVLAELTELHDALSQAQAKAKRFLTRPAGRTPLTEAMRMLSGSDTHGTLAFVRLTQLSEPLAEAIKEAKAAIARVPAKAVRHPADPYPIELIHDVLEEAWVAHDKGQGFGRQRLKPTSSPNSKFRQLMGICYEAMGQPTIDPYRAIIAYLEKRWPPAGESPGKVYTERRKKPDVA